MAGIAQALALLLAGSGVPSSHAASGAQDAAETDIIAGSADRNERLTVPVTIGTQGPFDFLIDTGSQNTVVSADLAKRLALEPDRRARIISLAGTTETDTVYIEEIGLGRRSYYGLVAPLLDHRDMGADGILGTDSLQNQRVLIDFRRNLIAVSDAKSLGGNKDYEIVIRARKRSGQLILTEGRIDGVKVDVVIDTGAQSSIGNRALQRAIDRRHRSQTLLTSVTGHQVLADTGMARQLKIADLDITNVFLAYTDSPAFAALGLAQRPALLLGMRELRVFTRIAIDFETRKVLFDLPPGH